jgi:ATP synthase protein I
LATNSKKPNRHRHQEQSGHPSIVTRSGFSSSGQIPHLLRWQGIICGVSILLSAPFGKMVLISAGVGGLACLLANAGAALWIFRPYRARQPARLVARLYSAEVIKMGLALGVLGLALALFDNLVLPVALGAYLGVQILPALIPYRNPSTKPAQPLSPGPELRAGAPRHFGGNRKPPLAINHGH